MVLLLSKKVTGSQLMGWWSPLFWVVVLRTNQELLPIRDDFLNVLLLPHSSALLQFSWPLRNLSVLASSPQAHSQPLFLPL